MNAEGSARVAGIRYRVGDATRPDGEGHKIIAHISNDIGAWGKGFVLALSRRWLLPERQYRHTYSTEILQHRPRFLGRVLFIDVEPQLTVATMIAQHDIRWKKGIPPIRYDVLESCLAQVAERAQLLQASVHVPRIGSGLAGGDWGRILLLVLRQLAEKGIEVTVYDPP